MNSRNGYSSKSIRTEDGQVDLETPRDRENTVFPQTQVQLCIVHMVRNSMKYVPWKDYKAVTADLKRIYQSVTE
jgi:transposase-like protein